jgi:hypothetical protein
MAAAISAAGRSLGFVIQSLHRHSVSPSDMEATRLASPGDGEAIELLKDNISSHCLNSARGRACDTISLFELNCAVGAADAGTGMPAIKERVGSYFSRSVVSRDANWIARVRRTLSAAVLRALLARC